MSWLDRLLGRGAASAPAREGRALEADGRLAEAVQAYLRADLPDEAARVLLARVDAEPSLERRMAFCAEAARVARAPELAAAARTRRARMALSTWRGRGDAPRSEVVAIAEELEAAGAFEDAAEAWALAGDREGEVRALTAAGSIDALEDRLARDAREARAGVERAQGLGDASFLDRTGERRAALRALEGARVEGADPSLEALGRAIRARVARGPLIRLRSGEGPPTTYALGDVVTVGRAGATLVVPAPALSRVHLVLRRGADGGVTVADGGTRNGTFLAGARLAGAIPVHGEVRLSLAGEVPCVVRIGAVGVEIEVAERVVVAPLGPLVLGAWRVALDGPGGDEDSFVSLARGAAPAYLGELELGETIELAVGDVVAARRGGPPVLAVLPEESGR